MNSPEQNKQILNKLVENYKLMEKSIVDQLQFSTQHHLTTGTFREEIWKNLFAQMIPQKFSIEQSVFIIDSSGKVSNEVDLAIFDEQYTPYIFRYGKMRYIPIEAVAVVVQCKSTNTKEKKLKDWTGSIDQLRTQLKSVTRTIGEVVCTGFDRMQEEKPGAIPKRPPTQTSTRPIKILCHTATSSGAAASSGFDIIIHPAKAKEKLVITIPNGEKNLGFWHGSLNFHADEKHSELVEKVSFRARNIKLNEYKVSSPVDSNNEVSLLSLTFKLNQLLMLINNPILFPHLAYVEMFKSAIDG